MLSKWAPVVVITILAAMTFAVAPATAARERSAEATPGSITTHITLKLERDGRLSVTERVTVPPGTTARREVALRSVADDGTERVFAVADARVDGAGSVRVDDEKLDLDLRSGTSTVYYSVTGTVAATGATQEMRWQVTGGWEVPVRHAEVESFVAPKMPSSISCLAGPVGTSAHCDLYEIGHTQTVRAQKFGLRPGEQMELAVRLPSGTVPPNAVYEQSPGPLAAFALTPASGLGLVAVGLLLIGGFGLLWYTRGRDARVQAGDVGPVDVLLTDAQGTVTFASPDGVLPGQVGTVVDEHVDVVDLTATVIDLAVRNYFWLEEIPSEMEAKDWRVVRLNPPDESLRPYERAVYELLLGAGEEERSEIRISDLRSAELDLSRVQDALYREVVEKGWFARRPDAERNLFWWLGVGVAACGVALTVLLAFTTSMALLGIGVALGGVGIVFGARLMPARTRRGSALVAQMRGLRDYLSGVAVDSIPSGDREMVFSRSLPYAVVLGETDRWLAEFAELDPAADGTPGLYWYGEFVEDSGHVVPNLRRFRSHLPLLLATLDSALAQGGQFRTLK